MGERGWESAWLWFGKRGEKPRKKNMTSAEKIGKTKKGYISLLEINGLFEHLAFQLGR